MKVYFAGPLFTTPERDWNAAVAAGLRTAGHDVFLPQEKEPGMDHAGIFAMDVAGIDAVDAVVAIVDGPDPDSGTAWEIGYGYGTQKPLLLVRTDIRDGAGASASYNSMLAESATVRLDLPGASTAAVIAEILDALATVGSDRSGTDAD